MCFLIKNLCAARVEKMKKNDEGRGRVVNKFSHGSVGGGGNPGASGGRGARNGGSHVPSGGGVTPLYAAAGAGGGNNNHHPHRGGGNRDTRGAGPETLAIVTFACFLILLCIN